MTTKALRDNDFELLVAPKSNGKASGSLYRDDGESLTQSATSKIVFTWDGQKIKMEDAFGFKISVGVKSVTVMGNEPQKYAVNATLTGLWEQNLGGSHRITV